MGVIWLLWFLLHAIIFDVNNVINIGECSVNIGTLSKKKKKKEIWIYYNNVSLNVDGIFRLTLHTLQWTRYTLDWLVKHIALQ